MRKWIIVVQFTFIFLLLGIWTARLYTDMKYDYELAATVSAAPLMPNEGVWDEEYLPYSEAELTALKSRIVEENITDKQCVVITRKTGFPQKYWEWNRDNYSYIWVPDPKQAKYLIIRHNVDLQVYGLGNGKMIYLLVDQGKVRGKSKETISKEMKNEAIYNCFGDLTKSFSRGGGGGRGGIVAPLY